MTPATADADLRVVSSDGHELCLSTNGGLSTEECVIPVNSDWNSIDIYGYVWAGSDNDNTNVAFTTEQYTVTESNANQYALNAIEGKQPVATNPESPLTPNTDHQYLITINDSQDLEKGFFIIKGFFSDGSTEAYADGGISEGNESQTWWFPLVFDSAPPEDLNLFIKKPISEEGDTLIHTLSNRLYHQIRMRMDYEKFVFVDQYDTIETFEYPLELSNPMYLAEASIEGDINYEFSKNLWLPSSTNEGTQTYTYTVYDFAGNSKTETLTINYDKTEPDITLNVGDGSGILGSQYCNDIVAGSSGNLWQDGRCTGYACDMIQESWDGNVWNADLPCAHPITRSCLNGGTQICLLAESTVETIYMSPPEIVDETNCIAPEPWDGITPCQVICLIGTVETCALHAELDPGIICTEEEEECQNYFALKNSGCNKACKNWAASEPPTSETCASENLINEPECFATDAFGFCLGFGACIDDIWTDTPSYCSQFTTTDENGFGGTFIGECVPGSEGLDPGYADSELCSIGQACIPNGNCIQAEPAECKIPVTIKLQDDYELVDGSIPYYYLVERAHHNTSCTNQDTEGNCTNWAECQINDAASTTCQVSDQIQCCQDSHCSADHFCLVYNETSLNQCFPRLETCTLGDFLGDEMLEDGSINQITVECCNDSNWVSNWPSRCDGYKERSCAWHTPLSPTNCTDITPDPETPEDHNLDLSLLSGFQAERATTDWVPGPIDGENTLSVCVWDLAGNMTRVSPQIIIDRVPPVVVPNMAEESDVNCSNCLTLNSDANSVCVDDVNNSCARRAGCNTVLACPQWYICSDGTGCEDGSGITNLVCTTWDEIEGVCTFYQNCEAHGIAASDSEGCLAWIEENKICPDEYVTESGCADDGWGGCLGYFYCENIEDSLAFNSAECINLVESNCAYTTPCLLQCMNDEEQPVAPIEGECVIAEREVACVNIDEAGNCRFYDTCTPRQNYLNDGSRIAHFELDLEDATTSPKEITAEIYTGGPETNLLQALTDANANWLLLTSAANEEAASFSDQNVTGGGWVYFTIENLFGDLPFTVTLTPSSGDPDLHVSFVDPNSSYFNGSWNCRPYQGGTSVEQCNMHAPRDADTAYVAIHGYGSQTSVFNLEVSAGGSAGNNVRFVKVPYYFGTPISLTLPAIPNEIETKHLIFFNFRDEAFNEGQLPNPYEVNVLPQQVCDSYNGEVECECPDPYIDINGVCF